MGCVCGKPSAIENSNESPGERQSNKTSMEYRASRTIDLSRREESRKEHSDGIHVTPVLRDKQANPPMAMSGENLNLLREKEKREIMVLSHPAMGNLPNATEVEHVAAGWPMWLAAVAGEAIVGWVPRRADSFEKLDKIGQGTYSNVYRARDLDQNKIVALKKVRFDNLEPESVRFMAREIHILRRLDHPNVIRLEGLVTSRMSCSLYLVFEYMEHDLTGLAAHPKIKFSEPQVKCYMQQLLRGLDHCHSRGVLHRDIKGSNLLIDNKGILKIADFGLASVFDPSQTQPLTSRVVTLWYRPPELLLGATNYGAAVDLWSAGCILAELYAGKPIMPGRTEVEQLHKIFKLCGSPSEDYWKKSKLPHATIFKPQQPYQRVVDETFKEFPKPALSLLGALLSVNPDDRGTASSALLSDFFTTEPLPCDPLTLPMYPPCKELDARVRDVEARRQVEAGSKNTGHQEQIGMKESRAVPAPNANAELSSSMQRRQSQTGSKSRSEMFNLQPEEAGSGFPMEPPRPSHAMGPNPNGRGLPQRKVSHSGPLTRRPPAGKGTRNYNYNYNDTKNVPSSQHEPIFRGMGRRLPESFKEASDISEVSDQREDTRSNKKDPILMGYGSKGKKIHYSGPLVVPSGNMDQMLKDHDRRIQEAVRRARIDRARVRKLNSDGSNHVGPNQPFVSGQ